MKAAVALVRDHLSAFVAINLLFFGLVAAGTVYSFSDATLQKELTVSIVQGFNGPPLSFARDSYQSGNVVAAALITFAVNSLLGAFMALTVPTLLLPFFGLLIGLYRAVIWGITLAPTSPELARAMVPHSLTLLLEGEGYILAMFGCYLLWRSAFGGMRNGLSGFVQGYRDGLRPALLIYALVLPVLAVAAIYEAFEVIYLVGTR